MLIIDVHVHTKTSEVERLINLSKKFKIDRICLLGDVLGYGFQPNEEQIRTINDLTIKLVSLYPEIFTGFCFLNPANSKKFINEEIDRCIKSGLKGLKLECSVNARDKRLDPIMERAQELNIPVVHHSWYKNVSSPPDESNPSDIADLASRFPGVNMIMPHLRGCGMRGILDVKPFANVFVDTSGGQPVSGIIEYAVKHIGAERILFGSDVYFPEGRDFSAQIACILGAKIKEKEKELVLGLNAKRILRDSL